VDEIGVFRMTERGLEAVSNPSELFLGDRQANASGSAVTALMEGTRPVLIEVQALAAKAGFGTPQRVAAGFDSRRLSLLLAVLEKRAGLRFGDLDVFLNVVGGVRMQEPAGDLAVAAALASSVYDKATPADAVFVGELGLGGEIRPVSQVERRIAEATNLGMKRVFVSERSVPKRATSNIVGVKSVGDLFAKLFQ
jgi:DNA repair protein RadA/Sms